MANIKFKKLLKEAAWDHTSGKALPTLEDVQKAYQEKKGLQETELTEAPMDKGFMKDWEKNCKVLLTHIKHEESKKNRENFRLLNNLTNKIKDAMNVPAMLSTVVGKK